MTTDLALDTLEARGLIRLAAAQPELEYLFRHALLQDTAYESLLKQERRALHQTVGQALEELYPDRLTEMAAVLARHFEQAGDTDKAINYLASAAKFAIERNALAEAHDLYGRARALLPPANDAEAPDLRRRRLEIDFGWVKAGFGFLSDDEQLDQLEPMVEQASRLGDLRMEADIRLHDGLLRMFRGERPASSPRLAATLKRVDEIAAQIGDPVIGALPKSIVGLFQVFTGDLRDGVRALEEAAPLLGRKHDFVGSSFALMALGMGLARLGRFDEALGTAGRAIEVAQDGDVIARIDALIGKSAVDAIRGDYDAAIPAALECTRMAEESGATACVVSSAYLTGEALLQQKKFADAQISFERSLSIANMTNERMFRPLASASLHATMASLGQPPVQHGLSIDAALAQTRESHDAWGEAIVLSKRAEAEFQKPADQRDEGRMLTDYAAAYAAFEEMGARPFWARVLRDWGHALLATGSTEEGRAKLREALAELDALGIAAEADAVRTELAA